MAAALAIAAVAAGAALFAIFRRPSEPVAVPADLSVEVTCKIEPIYGSLFLSYRENPIGTVKVANRGSAVASGLRISFTLQDDRTAFVVVPFTAEVPAVAPGESVEIPILPRLSNEVLSPQTREVTAGVQVLDKKTVVAEERLAVFVHGRNIFNWERPDRIAAFVDPQDQALAAFVQAVWHERPHPARDEFPPQNFHDAISILTGLAELGLRYMPDAETPISSRVDWKANDRVNYPWETLTNRTGDCDDLSVLCAAALEAVSVPTAIVVCPRHVLMMFDSGLDPAALDSTPLDQSTVIVWRDRVWIPIETTVLGRRGGGFLAAWAEGWARRESVSGEAAIAEVREGWKSYQPMNPAPGERTQQVIAERRWAAEGLAGRIEGALEGLRNLFIQNLQDRVGRVEEQVPAGPERDRAIGVLYAQSGLFDRARRSFEKALFAIAELAAPAPKEGGIAQAIKSLPLGPDTPYLLFDLGSCLAVGTQSPENLALATQCYEHAIGLLPGADAPQRGEFVLRLALIHRLQGDLAAEKRWADEAFRMAPFLRETYRELVAGSGARAGENPGLRRFLIKGIR